MKSNPATDFLELASEQRLEIIKHLTKQRERLTNIAKLVGASAPEIHRNLDRLIQSKIIKKDSDGFFTLTTVGKILTTQIPLLTFLSENKKYFETHSIENIPGQFIQRLGSLANSTLISSHVKILDKWNEIHSNSSDYIFNLLVEVPYSNDLFSVIEDRLNNKVKIKSIFSENANVSKERKFVLNKYQIKKYISDGRIERKMGSFSIVLLLNEKEALLMFPSLNGETDMSNGFYSNDDDFHKWCIDYFRQCWDNSYDFSETKLH